jgi:ribose 5-phosphate isomerase B
MIQIAIGGDHASPSYKEAIKKSLSQLGYSFSDFGTHTSNSVDYPDFAHPVAEAVESGTCQMGILICGSGNGVAITANKHQGIRAALCWSVEITKLARQHNDANVLCLPARFMDEPTAIQCAIDFINTPFEGGRHQNRVEKIACR